MQDSHFYSLALHRLPDVGPVTFTRLLDHFGSAEVALSQSVAQLTPLLKPVTLNAVAEFQRDLEASILGQKVLADLEWLNSQSDTTVLMFEDTAYPELLRQIPAPPPLLFVRGNPDCLSLPQIAIVGSRNPSSGGLENAQRFAEYLAANGFAITSGLALGVDAAAHEGALLAQGKTLAVMGTGINMIYPSRHRNLAQRILDSGGALISEFPLSTGAQATNFPQRNRIISGLSCGVLVVEAAIQSGSLITAKAALQQNREVFAVPGSIHNPLARGCHQLIRQGATLVETAKNIVEQLDGMLAHHQVLARLSDNKEFIKNPGQKGLQINSGPLKPQVELDFSALSPAEQQLMDAIGYDVVTFDELIERTGALVGAVAAQLIGLEIKGFVQQMGSGYQRV